MPLLTWGVKEQFTCMAAKKILTSFSSSPSDSCSESVGLSGASDAAEDGPAEDEHDGPAEAASEAASEAADEEAEAAAAILVFLFFDPGGLPRSGNNSHVSS